MKLKCGGVVVSWLVHLSLDEAFWVRGLGPVSRKPRRLFRPENPFLVDQYLKTERCVCPETSCTEWNL